MSSLTPIVLSSGNHGATAIYSSSMIITIQSFDPEKPAVLSVSSSITLFTLSSTSLSVKEFSIAVSAETTSLFYCDYGTNTLTLDSMNIYGVIDNCQQMSMTKTTIRSSSTVMILSIVLV